MSTLSFQRDSQRTGLYLPMDATRANPSLLFPFYKMDRSELDELARAELAKQGVTDESKIQELADEAERQYEERRKVYEARVELRRVMAIKADGGQITSVGFRKWERASFRPVGK